MIRPSEEKRCTGRTTRMLQLAKQLAGEGKHVYVVAATVRMANHMERAIRRMSCSLPPRFGIPVGQVEFITEQTCRQYDPVTMTVRGGEPNHVVLVDHNAIECRFAKVLEMWTRFDEVEAKEEVPNG